MKDIDASLNLHDWTVLYNEASNENYLLKNQNRKLIKDDL